MKEYVNMETEEARKFAFKEVCRMDIFRSASSSHCTNRKQIEIESNVIQQIKNQFSKSVSNKILKDSNTSKKKYTKMKKTIDTNFRSVHEKSLLP